MGYGLLSYSYTLWEDVTIAKDGFRNVYTRTSGSELPYTTELTYHDTHLEDGNDRYESNIMIIHNGNEGQKSAQSWWAINFFDTMKWENLGNDYLSAWVYYNSYN